jgi:hypothetical protein
LQKRYAREDEPQTGRSGRSAGPGELGLLHLELGVRQGAAVAKVGQLRQLVGEIGSAQILGP